MYFTSYNTYNNNIKWKPDNQQEQAPPQNKYIVATLKTINPAHKPSLLIQGSDFKAKPRMLNQYRYQYQTYNNNNQVFSNTSVNLLYKNTPGNNVTLTSTPSKNQTVCRFNNYTTVLANKKYKLDSQNAKRRVRNSNRPSTNICISTNEHYQIDPKLFTNNYNYYNQTYSHDTRQYLHNRCKTYEDNNKLSSYMPSSLSNDISNSNHSLFYSNCNPNSLSSDNTDSCCNKIIYKPSNAKFAKQGAVSSSTRLLNLKINTAKQVTKSNITMPITQQVSNTGYNNSFNNYTSKSKYNASGYVASNNTFPCDMSVYNRPNTC